MVPNGSVFRCLLLTLLACSNQVALAAHEGYYSKPYPCHYGEDAVELFHPIERVVCAPRCEYGGKFAHSSQCPEEYPHDVIARPKCVLEDAYRRGIYYCGLVCYSHYDCPAGSRCSNQDTTRYKPKEQDGYHEPGVCAFRALERTRKSGRAKKHNRPIVEVGGELRHELELVHMGRQMRAMKVTDSQFVSEAHAHHVRKLAKSGIYNHVEDDFHGWHAEIEAKEQEERLLAGQVENPDAEIEEDLSSKQVENTEGEL